MSTCCAIAHNASRKRRMRMNTPCTDFSMSYGGVAETNSTRSIAERLQCELRMHRDPLAVGSRFGHWFHLRIYSFEPDLAPIGRDRPRTKQAACAVLRLTHDPVEHDAGLFGIRHLAGPFVDELSDQLTHGGNRAAIRGELDVEVKSAVASLSIERRLYFRFRLDADALSGLETERIDRRRLAGCDRSREIG